MAKIDSILLRSKFRGCLLGALIGDCLGAPFEGEKMTRGSKLVLHNYFEKLDGPYFKTPFKDYTDDTAMTKAVARSLIEKPEVDFKHIAQQFVKEYFTEPKRGYGQNVVEVFHKLKNSRFTDIYKPATEQFNGMGSFGNGGAMRIAPIALFFHNDYNLMIDTARKVTEITHSNSLAIHGALLQCIAIHESLLMDPKNDIDVIDFVVQLKKKMELIEKEDDIFDVSANEFPYQQKLTTVMDLLTKRHTEELDEEVINTLGNGIAALHSVPTAIFCFLRSQSEIPGIKGDNVFRRTIEYAISLGGDTDTIASMAGSIAGAYLGEESIGDSLRRHCELYEDTLDLAENLYSMHEQASRRAQV